MLVVSGTNQGFGSHGVDDETDHHFLLSKCRVGCTRRNNN